MVHVDDAIKLDNVTVQYHTIYNVRTYSTLLTVPLSDSKALRTQFAVQSATPGGNYSLSATVLVTSVRCQQKYTAKWALTFRTYSLYMRFIVALTAGFKRGGAHVTSVELLGRIRTRPCRFRHIFHSTDTPRISQFQTWRTLQKENN